MTDDSMLVHLSNHPRMIGVLFTLLLLLAQSGAVMAGNVANPGP